MKQFNFSRLFLVLWMLLCNVFVFADDLITEQVVVNVEEPGTLPDKISDADKYIITSLKLIGKLNSTDVKLIRDMAGADYYNRETLGNLRMLDMTEASFVVGGSPFCLSNNGSYAVSVNGSNICDYFLANCKRIESIKMGDGVTWIGDYAFSGCTNLTNVDLSTAVVSLGIGTFQKCSSLQKIIIPENVVGLKMKIFEDCNKLENVQLSDNLERIASYAFDNCSKLASLSLPSSLQCIEDNAFKGCNSLSKINISSLESWMTISLYEWSWPNGIHLFLNESEIENLVIPSSVKIINDYAFFNCRYIRSISIPSSVVKINNGAFAYCDLGAVELPNGISELGNRLFYGCNSLEDVKLPSNLKKIGDEAFAYCQALNSIVLPDGVTELGNNVFTGCKSLEDVKLPSNLKKMGEYVFSFCSSLKKVLLPEMLFEIPKGAFRGCSSVYVSIPENINTIGAEAFESCEKMTLVCPWVLPITINEYVFHDKYWGIYDLSNCTLYVPKGSYEAYRTADVWKKFGVIKTIGSDEPQEPKDPEPCSAPTITYTSGNLSFESSTPGAEYHYTINDADVATDKYNTDGKVQLNGKLDISVYATADGYKASDKATATLYWLNTEGGDDTNNINLVKTRGVMVTTDSDITISGLNDGEVITFYSVNGVNLGSAKAVQGVLHFAKPNESIVIAKIKGSDLKIAIR